MNESLNTEPTSPIASSDPEIFNLPVMESIERHQEWGVREQAVREFRVPALEIASQAVVAESLQLVVAEDARIIEMKEENQKLRQLAQYLSTYNNSLKKLIEADFPTPTAKRALLAKLVDEYGLSRRHVCRLLNLARSTCWYRSTAKAAVAARNRSAIAEASMMELAQIDSIIE